MTEHARAARRSHQLRIFRKTETLDLIKILLD